MLDAGDRGVGAVVGAVQEQLLDDKGDGEDSCKRPPDKHTDSKAYDDFEGARMSFSADGAHGEAESEGG